MEFLVADKIVKKYANHLALDDVSITINKGKIFGLLGPNGAGKTSLIRIINQITAPDSGQILFNGEKLNPKHIARIGYLPEERGLYKKMKIGEQALYLSQLKGVPKNVALKRLKEWFRKFEIESWWDKKVEELSKGMQQKVQFIVTILHEPELLIFDEPFSGFDPINTNLLKQEILNLKEKGSTIIFSTHNMESVEAICDDIALINKSKLILQGPIHQIKSTYKQNIFQVCIEKNEPDKDVILSSHYQILDRKHNNGTTNLKIQIPENETTNILINNLMQFGSIVSFNEVIPSMNDIFIQVVESAE